jgi:hypothetical protein
MKKEGIGQRGFFDDEERADPAEKGWVLQPKMAFRSWKGYHRQKITYFSSRHGAIVFRVARMSEDLALRLGLCKSNFLWAKRIALAFLSKRFRLIRF